MSSKKLDLSFLSDFGNILLVDVIYKLGKWLVQEVPIVGETLALLVVGLATFLGVKPFIAQIIIVGTSICLFVLIMIFKNKSRKDEKKSQDPAADEIKTGMYVESGYGRKKRIHIVSALKDGNPQPLINALHRFKVVRFKLNEENVYSEKSQYAFLQVSFIIRNKDNEVAIYQRLGRELSPLPKLLTGCSILRSFSPATLRSRYLIESIIHRIGLENKDDIKSINPFGIGYNETTKENQNYISYFFIIYELVVDKVPEPMRRYGDNLKIQKPGEKFLGFFPVGSEEFSNCSFKGRLDNKIIGILNGEGDVQPPDSMGECLFVPSDKDVLKINM